MAKRIYVNNFNTTLNGSINNSTTTVIITSATGLPTLSGGDFYYLTLVDGSTVEIIKVTARSSTTLTVERGVEGTSAVSWASGSTVSMRATADSFDRKVEGAASSTDNAIPRFDSTTGKIIQGSSVIITDDNNITGAPNITSGYTATATAAGTTTLTVASNMTQVFTGSTTQTVVLPVVSTLTLGTMYVIVNLSSGVVTVQSSGANTIQAMAANSTLIVTSNATSGTGSGVWYVLQYTPAASGITGSGSLVRATSPILTTPDIVGTSTNNNASAGSVGEYAVNSATAVAMTSGVNMNVTSISLTAGDWEVFGNVHFLAGGSGNSYLVYSWTSSTSATTPGLENYSAMSLATAFLNPGNQYANNVPTRRYSLAGTTTIYLSAQYQGGVGSAMTSFGTILARRRR